MYEQVFPKTRKLVTFGSKTSTSLVNNQGSKITPGLYDFSRKTNFSSADDHTSLKPPGLVNLGNSCYMNSVMQCLNCLAPLVKFFTKDAHLEEVTSPVSSGGTVANEVGAIFSAMLTGRRSPLSLMALKSKVGELCHQFLGCEQQDSHEFLMYLFTWMHEELRGRGLSALESCGYTLRHLTEELTSEHSVISLLFQDEHRHVIACGNCHYKSITLEPFTILSLSLPASGKCTLTNLLENYYKECSIDYNCPKCNKGGTCVHRIFIQRLPPILILHLNRFEYSISARKKQNYVNFPLRQLSLGEHALSSANLASYDLCAVSNHHGTMNGGHCTSYCKPSQGDVWYQCDDKTVTRLRTPVKMSTAYLLFCDSLHADI